MKLSELIFGKKKLIQHAEQKAVAVPLPYSAAKKPNPSENSRADISCNGFQGCDSHDIHDFSLSYPFRCRKCGLECNGDDEEIARFMGSYFDDTAYQWNADMRSEDIVSFFLSTGNRPVLEARCNFSDLQIRNCLNGSRDGWMQSQYPKDYFEPKTISLDRDDVLKIKEYIKTCDFSAWITPDYYAANQIMGACGFHADETFSCQFSNGKKFTCLKPDNPEFKQLVSLLRDLAEKNASEKDRLFIKRMLEDTEKKAKPVYWLVSQSLEEKWMDLIAQGAPFFNYRVARDLRSGDHANAELMVNVIRFAQGAAWVTKSAVPESEYHWETLSPDTGNDLGAAIDLLTQHFKTLPEPKRTLFPIVILVLDGPITDDWLTAQKQYQSLPGVSQHVLTIALVLGNRVEKKFLKKFDGVLYHINSMEDIINELDSPFFAY